MEASRIMRLCRSQEVADSDVYKKSDLPKLLIAQSRQLGDFTNQLRKDVSSMVARCEMVDRAILAHYEHALVPFFKI